MTSSSRICNNRDKLSCCYIELSFDNENENREGERIPSIDLKKQCLCDDDAWCLKMEGEGERDGVIEIDRYF